MNLALKEWASVVAALEAGEQICLLRKGGIVEADRGFQLRQKSFLLFPTYEHEHRLLLKPSGLRFLEEPTDAGSLTISLVCEATDFGPAPRTLDALKRADSHFIWNDAFLKKRLDYKPDLPLYWILLRAYRLPNPVRIPERPSYAGCKSWVHLTEEIDVSEVQPVLSDGEYAEHTQRFRASLS